MRMISKPALNVMEAYDTCIHSISDEIKKNKFNWVRRYICIESLMYNFYALEKNLYKIKPFTSHHVDMKKLYTEQLVPEKKKGRKIYNHIMSLAPLNRCPFCGIGQVKTLDHYLPKANFSTFSVLPYNLVPSCRDCNTGKHAGYARTKKKQTLHPYYDNFTKEQWLFATVIQSNPMSIEYFVNPPIYWDDISKCRVKAHFDDYDLAKRFSIQASNELAMLNSNFSLFSLNSIEIKKQLKEKELTHKNMHLNSWESALYQALVESDWYCSGGFNND